ncbi:MAG: 50S ribosomal protein L11 methyltransferase [Chitinophagales bacterium]|nr:50S ribosomal protein L11 methyltransferase [Chitinophagales bacterium]MDW8419335.1 50S ribosomal protein L11 methyltransferase [Chitinophagales bacterium]
MRFRKFTFFTINETERCLLISLLNDHHFIGYEETSFALLAYVPEEAIRSLHVKEVLYDNDLRHITYSEEILEDKNWNEEWERNFQPVTIDGQVHIRAPHHPSAHTAIELIIEPKMSFGTGHHPTTAGVIFMMLRTNFEKKRVLDIGCGTGVLSMLAEKLGAAQILAIDNERWAYHNTLQNSFENECQRIIVQLNDNTSHLTAKYDIILANINRNVITSNLPDWSLLLNEQGELLISGILYSDENDIRHTASLHGLIVTDIAHREGWVIMKLCKK